METPTRIVAWARDHLFTLRPNKNLYFYPNIAEHYKESNASSLEFDVNAVGAYVQTRSLATLHVLEYCLKVLPRSDTVLSLLEWGCGPGLSAFLYQQYFPHLSALYFFEKNKVMSHIVEDVQRYSKIPIHLYASDVFSAEVPSFDLGVCSYSINELPVLEQKRVVENMWERCRYGLLIIVPGTPEYFQQLHILRARLIELKGHIVAPCGHQSLCSLAGTQDWCHFSVRFARSKALRHAKKASVPWEDEKFSYLLVTKKEFSCAHKRILKKPRQYKFGIEFEICNKGQNQSVFVSKRDKEKWAAIKNKTWGDLWNLN